MNYPTKFFAFLASSTVTVAALAAPPSNQEFEETIQKGLALNGCSEQHIEVIKRVLPDIQGSDYLVITVTQQLEEAKEGLIVGSFKSEPSDEQLKSLIGRKICTAD